MARKGVSRFCERCGGQASAVAKKSNHLIHLILTGLTLGAWVFVWMALLGLDKALEATRCTRCGLVV
jgi:ribosomal protein L37E